MQQNSAPALVVCYISGLDRRLINEGNTPFLYKAFQEYPLSEFSNIPSNELFPTMATGVSPSQHGVWGVRIRNDIDEFLRNRVPNYGKNVLATSWQCIKHYMTKDCDLAAIPPWRRERFNITRTKYKRRSQRVEALSNIGGYPTIFDVAGLDESVFNFSSSSRPSEDLLEKLCLQGKSLEALELYTLDRYQQWYGNDRNACLKMYAVIDDFLQKLHGKCLKFHKQLMILVDHGHEPVVRHIDIEGLIKSQSISPSEFTHFVEVSSARFWFHSEKARAKLTASLKRVGHSKLVHWTEMYNYGIPLNDSSYGEYHLFLDPGGIFFPHDFNQPLANIFMSLTDRLQKPRLFNSKHRGNHGHLPHFEAEKSMMLLCSKEFQSLQRPDATILSVAPSILSLIDRKIPDTMDAEPLFKYRNDN